MSGEDRGANVGLDDEARERLDSYLADVKKDLDEIDPRERKAILEEIDNAIREKVEILGGENNTGKIDRQMVEKVLEGFGSPLELAKGYAKVAKAGPGKVMRFLSLFEAFWAVFIFIPGAYLLVDAIMFWYPKADLVYYGQIILSLFFLVGCTSLFILIWLQLRDQAIRPEIGPFTIITTLALGIAGLSTFNIDRDFLLPGLPGGAVGSLLTVLAGLLLLGSVWGFGSLIANRKKDSTAATEEQSQAGPRKFPSKSKKIISMTTAVLVALFIVANGLLMTGGGFGNGRPKEGDQVYVSSEPLGGPYNASIEKWQSYTGEYWSDFYKIVYTVDGQKQEGSFDLALRPVLDWIKSNTPENATILCWWDYGHAVRGYTDRNSVIYYPSKNLMDTVADKSSIKQFEPEEKVRKVAGTLLADNASDLRESMSGLGATYILTISRETTEISYAIFQGAGLDIGNYTNIEDGRWVPNQRGAQLFLFRIWNMGEFNGTRVDYKDIDAILAESI